MTDAKPLPCPFCGGTDVKPQHLWGDGGWDVACKAPGCTAVGPTRAAEAEAIEAWNAAKR